MDKFEIFIKAAGQIAKERKISSLIELLSELARKILNVERCSLFVIDSSRDELFTVFAHGVKEIRIPKDKGIAGYVARTGEIYITENPYESEYFYGEVDKETGFRSRNILAVPIFNSKREIIGVYQAINKNQAFNDEDIKAMELISEFAGTALEAKMLQEKLNQIHKKAIIKLTKIAEYKERESPNHLTRVGLISSLLAKELGIEEEKCELLQLASMMHDIGKIGVPDHILSKKERLEPDEWEIMKKHPIIGFEILQDSESELLQMAAQIALEHHERWDGKGYPFGKKEREISLWARIVSVADTFDTLVSHGESSEQKLSIDEALSYINSISGRAFDPEIVEIFNRKIDQIIEICKNFRDL